MALNNEKGIGGPEEKKAKSGRGRAVLRVLGTILLIFITTGLILTCIFAVYVKNNLKDDMAVSLKEIQLNLSSKIYYLDRSSGEYKELSSLYGAENRVWVDYDKMPKWLEKAAIAIEDKRFPKHNGVDWYRTVAAFGNMFRGKDTFGASTITQQLIKNITEQDEVTVKRKILEIFRALEFEKKYSKEQIMEMYLNMIFLGERCNGVGAASQVYFGKNAEDLTLAECASLIGITNNPSAYDPYISEKNKQRNKDRQELILKEMLDQGIIDNKQYEEAKAQQLVFIDRSAAGSVSDGVNSWFVDAVIEDVIADLQKKMNLSYGSAEALLYNAGYKIYTTLDPNVQSAIDTVYGDYANMPSGYVKSERGQELQSSIVVVDPYSGDIVGMAGGMGKKTASRIYNRATDMLRPPGSTIKPLSVYSAGIDLGLITPYTTFNDAPNIKLAGTDWYPDNDTFENYGLVTVRYAITKSLNTIAAQIMEKITPSKAYNFLQEKYGITSLVPGADDSYAPMALGQLTNGVSVAEMASAYTPFVNKGIYTGGRTYTKVTDSNGKVILEKNAESHVAIKETTAYTMTDLMQGVVNGGTGILAKLSDMPTAGKTGAAGKWLDRWFVGYTPYYVGAIWSGYDKPEYMGTSNPSAILWKEVMKRVHDGLPYKDFDGPSGMRQVTICTDTGLLATDACASDVRGGHTMTLFMDPSKAPTTYCPVHVMQNVCADSHQLATENCPADRVVKVGVLDMSKVPNGMTINTPPFTNSDGILIPYVLSEMTKCTVHTNTVDKATGWKIDSKTGYLIMPNGMLYDKKTGKVYDTSTGWEVDKATGALIDPKTGKLIDPYTKKQYDGSWKNPVNIPSTATSPSPSPSPTR